MSKTLPDHLQLGVETSLVLGTHTIVEPDLPIFPMMDSTAARGPEVLLVIEVATTTLGKDLKLKAALYARYGLQGLWVIDTTKLCTTVHRTPVDGVWSLVEVLQPEAVLTHPSAPEFAAALGSGCAPLLILERSIYGVEHRLDLLADGQGVRLAVTRNSSLAIANIYESAIQPIDLMRKKISCHGFKGLVKESAPPIALDDAPHSITYGGGCMVVSLSPVGLTAPPFWYSIWPS